MARVAFLTRAIDEAGNAIGGSGTEVRIFDDFGATVATVVTDDTGGGTTIVQPLVPNAGTQTTLTVTTAAVDTTITVASTTGFAVGQLVPIYDGTNTVYRFIRSILAGPARFTLNAAVGFIFSSANTAIGNPDMTGVIAGWVPDSSYHYIQTKDVGSTRVMPPTLIPTMIGSANLAFQDEGIALSTRPNVNFKGTAITAVDNAPSTRVDVTVGGDFTDQAFLAVGTNHAASGVFRIPNAQDISARNSGNTGDHALMRADSAGRLLLDPNGTMGTINGAWFSTGSNPAAAGMIRLPTSPTISNRNAANTGDEQIWPILTATAALGGDVTMTNANTYYDGPSVSLVSGTWLVSAFLTVLASPASGTAVQTTGKLWDGSTVSDSREGPTMYGNASAAAGYANVILGAVIVLGSTTTIKASVASTIAAMAIKAAAVDNGAGNTASRIFAVRVG